MRTILHLSDLHFGAVDEPLVQPLRDTAMALKPDLIVISGDVTQRARKSQFRKARAFLDALPIPKLVVPGNHDVPLRNPWKRFVTPLANYRRFISAVTEPVFIDDEMAVVGVNSARSLAIKGGRINAEQMARVKYVFEQQKPDVVKVVVCHHPFDLHTSVQRDRVVGRAEMAMHIFADSGADVILSGHFHLCHTSHAGERYRTAHRSLLLVQAGTALSTRRRSEPNSFNLLEVTPAEIKVSRYVWDERPGTFARDVAERFESSPSGWISVTQKKCAAFCATLALILQILAGL